MEYGLSLGSNVGDRLAYLSEARRRIAALPCTSIVAVSAVYETEPVDVDSAFRDRLFLNAVLVVESSLDPEQLNAAVHAVEADMGRWRGADRNAPRPVDVDLIYADRLQRGSAALTLPHPRWSERRFVVQPLADVRPQRVIPPAQSTVTDLLSTLPATPSVVRFAAEGTW